MVDIQQLRDIEASLADAFNARRQVLSFDEFFELFCERPKRFLRTAPEYIRDCMAHYGTREVPRPGGAQTRFKIFDCPWNGGNKRVVGHEPAQDQLHRLLNNFVSEGRVTRLILLHGPNGSAKSSLVECLAQGLEEYSKTEDGAVYQFNWIFPTRSVAKRRLGFQSAARGPLTSYAHLPAEEVDARMPADLHDHPLLLLPTDRRMALLATLRESGHINDETPLADYLTHGDLAPRSHAIFEALLSA
ncbi:MAG: serine protein kinase, partial [Myxococcota bacterium]